MSRVNKADIAMNQSLSGIFIPPQPGIFEQITECGADLEKIG
ncbi:MAG: hypothetical protein Q9M92_08535 [Enterobacterales bacterium]|nr:hypothetical protein [Enterobacterales bacterium]